MSFPRQTVSFEPPICGVCGSSKRGRDICSPCQVRLIDLALSSADDEYPQLVEEASETQETKAADLLRYDHYEVCRLASGQPWELGRGAMGITYKATDTNLGCTVALKIINTRFLTSANARARFLREARTASHLRHANIASVFHLGLDEERCFYAMEYIEGETLDRYVGRVGALRYNEALHIVTQVARGLRVAHERCFIHRDIKPTNIMLVGDGEIAKGDVTVKLIDFGLVKAVSDNTAGDTIPLGYFAGTPFYASPEQLEHRAVDARSDIFSLGMCLWHMLAGGSSTLARVGDLQAKDNRGSSASKAVVENLPPAVASLLEAMVSPDPALRPQSAVAVLQGVEKCLAIPGSGRETDIRHRMRWLTWTGAGLLLLAVFLMGSVEFLPMRKDVPTPMESTSRAGLSAGVRALYTQANEAFRKNTKADNQRAIDGYSKVIAVAPDFAQAHAALATAYYINAARFEAPVSQLEQAIASAEHAAALDSTSPDAFLTLGAIRAFQGQPWEGLRQLHIALELDPKSTAAMCNFSLLWTSVGEPQLGLPWAMAAAQIDPSKVEAWKAAAEASVDLGADEKAEEYYSRCVRIKPTWMAGHCGLIHIHLLRGDFVRARQDFALADSIQSGALVPLTLKAQIALFGGEFSEADATYRQLLSMHREGFVSYYSGISYLSALGFLRLRAGDTSEGNAYLEEAAKLHLANSDGPAGIYDLAAVRAIQGRKEEALSLLRQSVASGWKDYRATRLDPRFTALRADARFTEMLEQVSRRVAQMRLEGEQLCSKPISLHNYPVRILGQ